MRRGNTREGSEDENPEGKDSGKRKSGRERFGKEEIWKRREGFRKRGRNPVSIRGPSEPLSRSLLHRPPLSPFRPRLTSQPCFPAFFLASSFCVLLSSFSDRRQTNSVADKDIAEPALLPDKGIWHPVAD
ncbi:unnamed protein product, partial [Phaeothamnion confervicola]